MPQSPKHVVVAGAGIVGASIAWHLAKAACAVTLIEATAVAARASGRSFGWINPWHGKRPRHYHRLNRLGVRAWREVTEHLALPVQWGGCIAWTNKGAGNLRAQVDELRAWGANVHTLDAEDLARRMPDLQLESNVVGALSEDDGWVDAAAATRVLVEAAQAEGAALQVPCRLTGTVQEKDKLTHVATSRGEIPATDLVVACGAETATISEAVGFAIPQRPTAGVIVATRPLPATLSHLLVADDTHVYQRADGALVMGQNQALDLAVGKTLPPRALEQAARGITARVGTYLPIADQTPFASATLGWRPLPADGFPVVGRSPVRPHVYPVVTHSGVTLAILLGRLVAREVIKDHRVDLLERYRPERFLV